MTPDMTPVLAIAAGLFVLGAIGFLTRRNLIIIMLSGEMMLHGVALTLVTFGRVHHTNEGQAFTIFTLVVAACEAGLGLALILALYQTTKSLDIELWTELREEGIAPPRHEQSDSNWPSLDEAPQQFPQLTPAGPVPRPDQLSFDWQGTTPAPSSTSEPRSAERVGS